MMDFFPKEEELGLDYVIHDWYTSTTFELKLDVEDSSSCASSGLTCRILEANCFTTSKNLKCVYFVVMT